MSLELSIICDGRIVLARSTGAKTVEDQRRQREETIRYCRDKGLHSILVDVRGEVYTSSLSSSFGLGKTTPEMTQGLHVAFVRESDNENIKFVDDVAANRGALTRSFLSLEEAQAWLISIDAGPNQPDTGIKK